MNSNVKIKYSYILLFLFFLITLGCSKKENSIESTYKIYLEKEIKEVSFSDFIEEMDSIMLETNEHSMIGVIGKLNLFRERIYILDNYFTKALFVFDRQGKFITKMQKLGSGPEEYLSLNDFMMDEKNQQILILADGGRKIIFTDYDLNYKKEQKLEMSFFSYIFPLGENYVLANQVTAENEHLIYVVDNNFEIKKKYLSVPEEYYTVARGGLVGYTGYRGNYLFVPALSPVIYSLNENGLSAKYEFILDNNIRLTPEKIKEFSHKDKTQVVEQTMRFFDLTGYFDLKDYLFTTFSFNDNRYWCTYSPKTNKVKYINKNRIRKDTGIDPNHLYFTFQVDENSLAGFLLDPNREEKELNPMIIICKFKQE